MRLNRGTFIFIVALLAVIALAVVVNNNQQQTVATPTPQPTQAIVRLFPELDGARAARLEIRDNLTGNSTVLTRDPSFLWAVAATGATVPTENRIVDQVVVPTSLTSFANLSSTESFSADDLASFGLAQPTHTLTLTTDDGGVYTVHIGNANLTGNRYFAAIEFTAGSGAAAPTAIPTTAVTPTLPGTQPPAATPTVAEPTAMPTIAATSTPRPTGAPTETPTATATAFVNLAGSQTIYLVPKDVVDALINYIISPPYLPLPTSTPTLLPTANPFSEVEQTATAAVEQTATAIPLALTSTALAQPTTDPAAVSTAAVTPPLVSTAAPTDVPPTATVVAPSATPVPATATDAPASATPRPATSTPRPTNTPRPTATATQTATSTPRP